LAVDSLYLLVALLLLLLLLLLLVAGVLASSLPKC
jgi:hypothetical protein